MDMETFAGIAQETNRIKAIVYERQRPVFAIRRAGEPVPAPAPCGPKLKALCDEMREKANRRAIV